MLFLGNKVLFLNVFEAYSILVNNYVYLIITGFFL